jgi:hypothetical protein
VTHGINGDFALIAETTDFGVTWIEAGAAYFKVTVDGKSFYTPRIPERGELKDNPNALIKMIAVIEAIEKWAIEYERKHTIEYPVGKMVPKVSIGAIRAGAPYKPSTRRKVAASMLTCACRRRWSSIKSSANCATSSNRSEWAERSNASWRAKAMKARMSSL